MIVNKLKTTPTPNKNGSYGIRGGGSYAIFWGSVCHTFCRSPFILTDVYAIRTPIVWHILGAYFLQIWGCGGGQNYFQIVQKPPVVSQHFPVTNQKYPQYCWEVQDQL